MSAANSPRGRSPTSSWRSRVASTPLLPSADCWRGCYGGNSLRAVRCGPPRRCSLPGTWGGRTGSFAPPPCGACSPPGWRDGSPDLSPDEKENPLRSYRKELWFHLPQRMAFVNITREVETCLGESGVREGLCLVNAMHITASVFINDDEGGLHRDYERWLEDPPPQEPISRYLHNRTGEDNGDAHLKRQVMGREVVVAITEGALDFGPWEQVFYGDVAGRRA